MCMFMALVGTNMQYIINMLEEILGEGPMVDPEELLTSDIKAKFEAACQTEGKIAKVEGEMDPEHKTTIVKATASQLV